MSVRVHVMLASRLYIPVFPSISFNVPVAFMLGAEIPKYRSPSPCGPHPRREWHRWLVKVPRIIRTNQFN